MLQTITTTKISATLKNDIQYYKNGKEVIVKKGTFVLVDTEKSIVLINNEDHTDIDPDEYTAIFLN